MMPGDVMDHHPHLDYISHPAIVVDPHGPFIGCQDVTDGSESIRGVVILDNHGQLQCVHPFTLCPLGSAW